jgi:hypothetical protein
MTCIIVLPYVQSYLCNLKFWEDTFKRKSWEEKLTFNSNLWMDHLRASLVKRFPGHNRGVVVQAEVWNQSTNFRKEWWTNIGNFSLMEMPLGRSLLGPYVKYFLQSRLKRWPFLDSFLIRIWLMQNQNSQGWGLSLLVDLEGMGWNSISVLTIWCFVPLPSESYYERYVPPVSILTSIGWETCPPLKSKEGLTPFPKIRSWFGELRSIQFSTMRNYE